MMGLIIRHCIVVMTSSNSASGGTSHSTAQNSYPLQRNTDIVVLLIRCPNSFWGKTSRKYAWIWANNIKNVYVNQLKWFRLPKRIKIRNRTAHNRRLQRQRTYDAWAKWDIDQHLIEKEVDTVQNTSDEVTYDDVFVVDVPKHQRTAGMRTGLSLLLHPDLENAAYDNCDSLDGVGFRVINHVLHMSSPQYHPESFIKIESQIMLDFRFKFTHH